MEYRTGSKIVTIDLHPGIYTFDTESGIGKTYLKKLLDNYVEASGVSNILTMTSDSAMEASLTAEELNNIINNKYELVMCDRADMYLDEKLQSCLSKATESVVLLAVNYLGSLTLDWKDCDIEITREGITVCDYL